MGSCNAAILRCLEGRAADSQTALQLARPMEQLLHASTLSGKIDAWVEVMDWTRAGGGRLWKEPSPWSRGWERMEFFIHVIESDPTLVAASRETISAIVEQAEAVGFFAESGMPADRGALSELWDSLMRMVLPQPREDHKLANLAHRLFRKGGQVERFQKSPREIFRRQASIMFPKEDPARIAHLRAGFADAFRILGARVQAQFFSEAMRARQDYEPVKESAAHRLALMSEHLADAWLAHEPREEISEAWKRAAHDAESSLDRITRGMETAGISVDLVHSIETIKACLFRMRAMHRIMTASNQEQKLEAIHQLLGDLVRALRMESSPLHILSTRTAMLHRKIVERAGQTGSHYIANSLREYRQIWLAAAGGGLLTVGTAAVKLMIHEWHHVPLFVSGLAAGLNYAASFMIMHTFHLILATKQPAMTAAHLAAILRQKRGPERAHEVADFAAQISYSQIAAAISNIIMVALGSCGFVLLWQYLFHHPYLSEESASNVFKTLSPLNSGTIFFAAWTGVLLWLASVIGGWFDNWSVYHRLPDGIRDHRLGKFLGQTRLAHWGEVVRHNMNGWATNISLGMLLGMTPVLGAFIGIPLEVRHVTLSTGQLSIAAASLNANWFDDGWFLRALAGIGVMFVLNLSVSFLCSLFTAARAYRMPPGEVASVLMEIFRHVMVRPLDFLRPFTPQGRRD